MGQHNRQRFRVPGRTIWETDFSPGGGRGLTVAVGNAGEASPSQASPVPPAGAGEALRPLVDGVRALAGPALLVVALSRADGPCRYRTLAWDERGPVRIAGAGLGRACGGRDGPGGLARREGRPVVVADTLSDPLFHPWREEAMRRGIRSAAFLPLRFRREVLGVLGVFLARPGGLAPPQVAVLGSLADLAASALALADRSRRLKRRVDELAVFERASRLAIPLVGEQETLDFVAGELLNVFGCDAVVVRVVDEGQDEVMSRSVAAGGRPESRPVVLVGEEVTRLDLRGARRVRHFADRAGLGRRGALGGRECEALVLRSGYVAPLAVGTASLGQVIVGYRDVRPFSAAEARTLALLAERASFAVLNALLYEEARHEARTDSLTGLWNHRTLLESLSHELAKARVEGREISLVFIDLDGFKAINDGWGHPEGDALLRQMGEVIRLATPPGAYACRYGGDEFAVLLPGAGPAEAARAAEALRRAIADAGKRFVPRGARPVTASIGVASFPAARCTVSELVRAANQAMYAAKGGGRNRVCTTGVASGCWEGFR